MKLSKHHPWNGVLVKTIASFPPYHSICLHWRVLCPHNSCWCCINTSVLLIYLYCLYVYLMTMSNRIQMMNLMVFCIHSSRHKGKTALEMASRKHNLQALVEEHTAMNKPVQVNGMSNGSVSPLLKRCSISNRGRLIETNILCVFIYIQNFLHINSSLILFFSYLNVLYLYQIYLSSTLNASTLLFMKGNRFSNYNHTSK